nr:hypothetical protein 7 [bacterium]
MTATLYRSENKKRGWGFEAYELEERHLQAIDLLSAGLTMQSVAECVGVTGQTIHNWKRNPTFKKALAKAIGMDAELHRCDLIRLYGKALNKVDQLLDSKNEHIRLQAGRLIMEAHQATIRLAEEQEMLKALEARLDAIQEAANGGTALALNGADDAEFVELDNSENGHS